MSYSFSVQSASKAAALTEIESKLAGVVTSQPVHAVDQAAVLSTAQSFLALLPEGGVTASVSGSVTKTDTAVSAVSVSVNLSHAQ